MTTLIKNGTIITATDTYKADILVKSGLVSEIGREISKIASEIIDAADKWVLPGAVDVHTHLDAMRDGMTTVDDFETSTAAAAAGGTTRSEERRVGKGWSGERDGKAGHDTAR